MCFQPSEKMMWKAGVYVPEEELIWAEMNLGAFRVILRTDLKMINSSMVFRENG